MKLRQKEIELFFTRSPSVDRARRTKPRQLGFLILVFLSHFWGFLALTWYKLAMQ